MTAGTDLQPYTGRLLPHKPQRSPDAQNGSQGWQQRNTTKISAGMPIHKSTLNWREDEAPQDSAGPSGVVATCPLGQR